MFSTPLKKSHKVWRKEVKKMRRKKRRQLIAKQRDIDHEKENAANCKNPMYLTWLANQQTIELIREDEEEQKRIEVNKKWQEYDKKCVQIWNEKQEKLAIIERAKQKELLRKQKEFEVKQKRLQDLKDEKEREAEEKQRKHEQFLQSLDKYIDGIGKMPVELTKTADTNPSKSLCPFFMKTATCRFGDNCSRNHSRPLVSHILLLPNFFTHIRLEKGKPTEYGSDFVLEFEEYEVYQEYVEFFIDVVPEFEQFGRIEYFCVCNNQEIHLRGNAYIEYHDQRDAIKAYRHMLGRYYAGRMLNIEFCTIDSWMAAICGLSFTNKCPKGRNCNFLHIFKNPNNRYSILRRTTQATKRSSLSRKREQKTSNQIGWDDDDDNENNGKRPNHWRWSESPEPFNPNRVEYNQEKQRSTRSDRISISRSKEDDDDDRHRSKKKKKKSSKRRQHSSSSRETSSSNTNKRYRSRSRSVEHLTKKKKTKRDRSRSRK